MVNVLDADYGTYDLTRLKQSILFNFLVSKVYVVFVH